MYYRLPVLVQNNFESKLKKKNKKQKKKQPLFHDERQVHRTASNHWSSLHPICLNDFPGAAWILILPQQQLSTSMSPGPLFQEFPLPSWCYQGYMCMPLQGPNISNLKKISFFWGDLSILGLQLPPLKPGFRKWSFRVMEFGQLRTTLNKAWSTVAGSRAEPRWRTWRRESLTEHSRGMGHSRQLSCLVVNSQHCGEPLACNSLRAGILKNT